MAYIKNGTARLVSRKENTHKSFPGLSRPGDRPYAAPLVRSASSTRSAYGHLRLTAASSFASVVAIVRPIPAVDAVTRAVLYTAH
jgi:hypothetical protein